jgi:hypothetical protein
MDAALISGQVTLRDIGRQFNVSKDALARHKRRHLPASLLKAHEAKEAAVAGDLLSQARNLHARTLSILDRAEASGEHRVALSAIREARANIELLGRLAGELQEGPVNILISSQWLTLRTAVLEALISYPEARASVSVRLLELGNS